MFRKTAIVLVGLLLLASIGMPALAQNATCDETQIRTAIQRVIDEGFNQGNTAVVDEVFAEDYIAHPDEMDREGFKTQLDQIRAAIPNGQATIDYMLVQGCDTFFAFRESGIMDGALGSGENAMPASGNPLTLDNHVYIHFNDSGLAVEEWDYSDSLPMMMQFGMMPDIDAEATPDMSAEATPEMSVGAPIQVTMGGNETQNADFVRQVYEQTINGGDMDALSQAYAPDYVEHDSDGTTSSLDEFKGVLTALHGAMPDFKVTINGMVAEGDYVATRVTLTGTFQNDLTFPGAPQAFPATNQPFSLEMSFLDKVTDGKIVENWTVYDEVSFLSQFGLMNLNPEATQEAGS